MGREPKPPSPPFESVSLYKCMCVLYACVFDCLGSNAQEHVVFVCEGVMCAYLGKHVPVCVLVSYGYRGVFVMHVFCKAACACVPVWTSVYLSVCAPLCCMAGGCVCHVFSVRLCVCVPTQPFSTPALSWLIALGPMASLAERKHLSQHCACSPGAFCTVMPSCAGGDAWDGGLGSLRDLRQYLDSVPPCSGALRQ